MMIGYARTSTVDQQAGLDAQLRDLVAAGCEKVFSEKVSSVAARAQLAAALDYCREGDVLTVSKPDRLARSVADLLGIIKTLEDKGAGLRILSMNGGGELDTRNPTSRLMLNVLASVAQFEREIMLERQREGIAKAKAEGRYQGRTPTARRQADEVRKLKAEGMGTVEIAKRLSIGRTSVHRILNPKADAAA